MTDTTPMQQSKQGQETIHQALHAALNQNGVSDFFVMRCGERRDDWTFVVTVQDHAESLLFTREEIVGSAQRLNSFAAAKVRALADRVIRHGALRAIAQHALEVAAFISQPGHSGPDEFQKSVGPLKSHGPDVGLRSIEGQLQTIARIIDTYLQHQRV
jgi:hypothetical protein